LNAYIICLRCTQGSTIKRIVQVGRLDESVSGSIPEWKDTFSIDDKVGEIYQMQRTEEWYQGGALVREMKAWFQVDHE
jgi:hypothetical protein